MPELLVCITTAHRFEFVDPNRRHEMVDWWESVRCCDPAARRSACRSTWINRLNALNIPYNFFFGRPNVRDKRGQLQPCPDIVHTMPDEVILECGDYYRDNSHKVQAVCRYALEHDFNYAVRIDDDTFVYPDRLMAEDWRGYDYSGAMNGSGPGSFHSGGCLFLSRRAMELVANAPITIWCDDVWIGRVMEEHSIPTHELQSLCIKFGDEYIIRPETLPLDHKYSVLHSCHPEVMMELWNREHHAT